MRPASTAICWANRLNSMVNLCEDKSSGLMFHTLQCLSALMLGAVGIPHSPMVAADVLTTAATLGHPDEQEPERGKTHQPTAHENQESEKCIHQSTSSSPRMPSGSSSAGSQVDRTSRALVAQPREIGRASVRERVCQYV